MYLLFIKQISDLPVSRNSIKDRLITMICNVQHQLKGDVNNCKYFFICLDETSDVTSSVQLAVIARFSNVLTRKELVKLGTAPISTSGNQICNIILKMLPDLRIDMSKVVSITTDGVEKKVRFVKLFMEAIGHLVVLDHSIIH